MKARAVGFLHWLFPAMLGLVAFTVILSGRDLTRTFEELQAGPALLPHPAIPWGHRFISVMLVLVALERIAHHVVQRKHVPSPVLLWAFIAYWVGTVAAPAMFGSHPQLSHEYLYSLVIGFGAMLATGEDYEKCIAFARNALFIFLAAGLVLLPIDQALVLDASYSQGLLPGVPRLGGLAPHPVALGMVAQTALLCLWCRPFRHRLLTLLSWVMGLSCLFLAQSKTAWITFALIAVTMFVVRSGPRLWRRVGDPRQNAFGAVVCFAVISIVLVIAGLLVSGVLEANVSDFFDTAEGAQIMSLTGRDRIWQVAVEEWQSSPMFGYGPGLWDDEFRRSIGMPNATNAHNQFMDTLARSGSIGGAALVIYACVLFALSVRYARATGGFSLALFLALAMRSISEVPLLMFGYGLELFAHLLLLITLAAAAGNRQTVEVLPPRGQEIWRTASP
jgi:O-antigen ligase